MMHLVAVFCLFSTLYIGVIKGCYIHGTDSGECVDSGMDKIWRETNIPFCADVINFPVCVPKVQTLPPSREFPQGRWSNFTVQMKDGWVSAMYETHIYERVQLEINKTLKRARKDEYGEPHRITTRFHRKPDCMNAFKNMFCWINFPRCDIERDLSMPTCRSACENFFKACGYDRDLWRCGKSMYFNGYEPEKPITDSVTGDVTYLREYFPGQPFRENKYTTGGSELPICTPAITGSGPQGASLMNTWKSFSVILFVILVLRLVY